MEDAKPALAPVPDDCGAMESCFADLCKTGLGLDEIRARQATTLFNETKPILLAYVSAIGAGSPFFLQSEEVERLWSGFVLYYVKKLGEGKTKQENEDGWFNLPRILRAAKLNVVDFFKEMPQFLLKAGHVIGRLYGSDWEKRLEVYYMPPVKWDRG